MGARRKKNEEPQPLGENLEKIALSSVFNSNFEQYETYSFEGFRGQSNMTKPYIKVLNDLRETKL